MVLVLATVVAVGFLAAASRPGNADSSTGESLASALEVMTLVKSQYVDPVSLLALANNYVHAGTINGMLRKTLPDDPYTRYMSPAAYENMQIETGKAYGGIGLYVGMQGDAITVVAPIRGTPADRAGVKAGDKIRAVDGRSTANMSVDEAVSLMRGPAGKAVELELERPGVKALIRVRMVREIIQPPSVESKLMAGHIGYIKLDLFGETSPEEMEKALRNLESQGMKGLILDLRFNPGGYLPAAIQIANDFIRRGPIMYIVGRDGKKQAIYASGSGTHPDYPMVVLVNMGSASASEIVSGALKDTGRATLVGTRTFGKGLVQTVFTLGNGGAVAVTTQRYLTAGGHSIHKVGVQPDVVVYNPGDREMEQELRSLQSGSTAQAGQGTPSGKGGQTAGPKGGTGTEQKGAGQPPAQSPAQGQAPAQPGTPGQTPAAPAQPGAGTQQPDPQLDKALEILKAKLAHKQVAWIGSWAGQKDVAAGWRDHAA